MVSQQNVSREEEIKRVISCSLKRYKNELSIRSGRAKLPMFSLLILDEIRAVDRVQEAMQEQWRDIYAESSD